MAFTQGTLESFLAKLKTTVEGVDPNIGYVFTDQRTFLGTEEMEDNLTFTITETGLLDDELRVGKKVMRFWTTETLTTDKPLTNGSNEYRHQINLRGFFSYESDNSQEVALRKATAEILDAAREQSVELTDLSTGAGYMGYLDSPPLQLEAVSSAALAGTRVQGQTTVLQFTFYEEVTN